MKLLMPVTSEDQHQASHSSGVLCLGPSLSAVAFQLCILGQVPQLCSVSGPSSVQWEQCLQLRGLAEVLLDKGKCGEGLARILAIWKEGDKLRQPSSLPVYIARKWWGTGPATMTHRGPERGQREATKNSCTNQSCKEEGTSSKQMSAWRALGPFLFLSYSNENRE